MPRYYLDLINGHGLVLDELGQEHSSRDSLRMQAIRVLPDIARDELPEGDGGTFTIRVRDERGIYIFEASLSVVAKWLD